MEKLLEEKFEPGNTHFPIETTSASCEQAFTQCISIATLNRSAGCITKHFRHFHSHYEFCLPLSPIPFLMINDSVIFGEVGWVYPFPSGIVHGLKYDISEIMQSNIAIDKTYFESIMREKGCAGRLSSEPFRATDELKIYIEAFKKEYSKGKVCDNHKLRHLTALICDELIDESLLHSESESREMSGYQRGIHSAAEFINNNYDKPVSLNEVAKMCGLSRNYFTVCFKQVLGKPPLEYLTALRISKAKQLLETTSGTVLDIALKCGFFKLNTFTQAFRKATGVNPTEYRRSRS